jgi:hypothetical protein
MTVMRMEASGSAANPVFSSEWWSAKLAGPIIAAAALRFALLALTLLRAGTSGLASIDTYSYLEPGRNLLLHGRFFAGGIPEIFRTPGYPLFFAVTSLAGLPAASVANVLLSLFSVLLVWRLGRSCFGDDRIALGAAWIFAIEPLAVARSVQLLSDTLFLALLLLSLERVAEFLRSRRLPVLAGAGLWLAVATFVRPVTYYLPFALAAGLFLVLAHVPYFSPQQHQPDAGNPGLRWKAPAVLLLCAMPWLALWQMRNGLETGYYGFSSITEENLYFYSEADVIARLQHRNFIEVQDELDAHCNAGCGEQATPGQPRLEQNPALNKAHQGPRLAFMRAEALHVFRAHYGIYMASICTSFLETAFFPGMGSVDSLLLPKGHVPIDDLIISNGPVGSILFVAQSYPWIAVVKAVAGLFLIALYLLAARGARRIGSNSAHLRLLLGTMLYFLAISAAAAGPGADARYRLPVMPAVCILAAAGLQRSKPSAA